jgi:hypothetical protein
MEGGCRKMRQRKREKKKGEEFKEFEFMETLLLLKYM